MSTESLLWVNLATIINLATTIIIIGYFFFIYLYDIKKYTVLSGNIRVGFSTLICVLILVRMFLAIQISMSIVWIIIGFSFWFLETISNMLITHKRWKIYHSQENDENNQDDEDDDNNKLQ